MGAAALDTVDSLKYKVRCESGTVSAVKIRTRQSRRHGTFLQLPTVCPHPLLSTRRINQISLRIVETKPGKPSVCWDIWAQFTHLHMSDEDIVKISNI